MQRKVSKCSRAILPLALVVFLGSEVAAQGAGKSRQWRFEPAVALSAEYDDNIYLMAPGRTDRISNPPASSPASRFAGMQQSFDVISRLDAELRFSGPGLGGRRLTISPDARYDRYALNADRSGPQYGVTVAQNMARGARVRVQGKWAPSTFYKNYLSNAVDRDGNGSIAPGERVYSPGAYAERRIAADYRHRLKKGTKRSPTESHVMVGLGHEARTYDAPFAVRDYAGPTLELEWGVDRRRSSLGVEYEFASRGATPGRTVRLLNEADYNVDFNGNGTRTDVNARAFELVDRSRTEHALSVKGRVPLGGARLELSAGHRQRHFSSTQPYDASNNGRKDARNEVGAELAFRVAPATRMRVEFNARSQAVNKPLNATGDEADYSRRRLAVAFDFLH